MRRFITILCLLISTGTAQAQDIHFSQYFTSPLTLNPALTGMIQGNWRAAANFRQQWQEVSFNPYLTGSFSFDMVLLEGKLPEGDALGLGLLGYYDEAGSGGYKNTTIGISLAYHKALGYDNKHNISVGLQGALVQKSLEFSRLRFEDQYRYGIPEDLFPTTTETFGNADLTYPDFNVGVLYSGVISENASWYAGLSYYHLTRPVETFLGGTNKINSRYTASVGGYMNLSNSVLLYLSSMYQSQGPAWELLYGGTFGFPLLSDRDDRSGGATLYLGAWYRQFDAVIPYVGFEFKNFQLGLSYDVTLSKAQPMTTMQGGYECSLIYDGFLNPLKRPTRVYPCPRF